MERGWQRQSYASKEMPTIKLSQETYNRLDQRIKDEVKGMLKNAKTDNAVLKLFIEVGHKKKGISYNQMISKLLND